MTVILNGSGIRGAQYLIIGFKSYIDLKMVGFTKEWCAWAESNGRPTA